MDEAAKINKRKLRTYICPSAKKLKIFLGYLNSD